MIGLTKRSYSVDSSDDSDDNEVIDANTPPKPSSKGMGACETLYKDTENSKTLLLAMCYGLKGKEGQGTILGDVQLEPYLSAKQRKYFNPAGSNLKAETSRRAQAHGLKMPKNANFTKVNCYAWLSKHPVEDPVDIEFLRKEETTFRNILAEAATEGREMSKKVKAAPWVKNDPFLRLYHCLTHDTVKVAFLDRDMVMDREELDARNCDMAPKTYQELVAGLFNDLDFQPESLSLPKLHSNFSETKVLRFEDMPGPMTPEDVKLRLADARAKLILVINKWEKSGNVFGQRDEDDADFGFLEEHHHQDDNRSSFLTTYKSHILYFWHLSDQEDILQSVKAEIDEGLAVSSEFIPQVVTTPSKRLKTEEAKAEHKFRENVGTALERLSKASHMHAYTALCEQISNTRKEVADYHIRYLTASDEPLKAALATYKTKSEATLSTLEEQLEDMKENQPIS
jgi:hypothetical protein